MVSATRRYGPPRYTSPFRAMHAANCPYDVLHGSFLHFWRGSGAAGSGTGPSDVPRACGHRDRKKGEKQMGEILDAGITTFVCLQVGVMSLPS